MHLQAQGWEYGGAADLLSDRDATAIVSLLSWECDWKIQAVTGRARSAEQSLRIQDVAGSSACDNLFI